VKVRESCQRVKASRPEPRWPPGSAILDPPPPVAAEDDRRPEEREPATTATTDERSSVASNDSLEERDVQTTIPDEQEQQQQQQQQLLATITVGAGNRSRKILYKCKICGLKTHLRGDFRHHIMRELHYKPFK